MSRMEGNAAWHHSQTLAAGQVAEFKVWGELVRQSRGGLHVFLPLRDRGIDGVLHRLGDGEYIAIQVKGRTSLTPAGQVHITVTATSLVDDDALIVGTLVDGPELGEFVLVVSEADFRRLAAHDVVEGREYLTAAFELHRGGESRWAPFLVPRDDLSARIGASRAPAAPRPHEWGGPSVDRATEGLVEQLLPVLDSFELALKNFDAAGGEDTESVRKGVELVYAELLGVLEKAGLSRVEADGKPFDPNVHEAVMQEEGDGEPVVTDVLRTGYTLKGRVLRPAMVKVSR